MGKSGNAEDFEDEEKKAAFEQWKSKTYALTVPLTIVALQNSLPPLWLKVRLYANYVCSYLLDRSLWTLQEKHSIEEFVGF